ncbi:retention module-containing protein, partial [Larsenimonas suaedae]
MAKVIIERIDGALFSVNPQKILSAGEAIDTGVALYAPDGARLVTEDGTVLDVSADNRVLLESVDGRLFLTSQADPVSSQDADVAELLAAIERGDDPTRIQEGPAAGAGDAPGDAGGDGGGFGQGFNVSRTGREETATYRYEADSGSSATFTDQTESTAAPADDTAPGDDSEPNTTVVGAGPDPDSSENAPIIDSSALNQPPSAPTLDLLPLTEDAVSAGQVIGQATATDPDGDAITYGLADNDNGYLAIDPDNGEITLTQAGVDAVNDDALDLTTLSVTVTASDGELTSTATETITVNRVNDAPTDVALTLETLTEGDVSAGQVIGQATATDPEGEAITYGLTDNDNGYLAIDPDSGEITLTQAGVDAVNDDALDLTTLSVTVTASDGELTSTATKAVTINRVNDAPVAEADSADPSAGNDALTTAEDTALTIAPGTLLANDSDADGDTLTITGVSGGQGGTAALNADGTITFTPDADFNGDATFRYTVSDGQGGSDTATVTVAVTGVNDAAVITGSDSGEVTEDTVLTTSGVLTATDTDAGESGFVAQPNTTGSYGSFAIDASGNWTYQLDNESDDIQALGAGDQLTETFTVTTAGGDTETVTITVNGTDDAAEITGVQTGSVTEDTALTTGGVLTATDTDADESGFVAQPNTTGSYGSFAIDAAGNWTYQLDNANSDVQALGAGDQLSETFTVTTAGGDTETVTITVN